MLVRSWMAVAVGGLLACLTACSGDEGVSSALMDDYNAGYAAGAPLAPGSFKDQHHCEDFASDRYDGDSGFEAGSSDEALVFWSGCLDGVRGGVRITSAEGIADILED